MLVLAIWVFLIGYAVIITGKRNLGVSYVPQADGSIKATDQKGNQASTFSLLDVVTCSAPSGATASTAAAPRTAGTTGARLPSGAPAGGYYTPLPPPFQPGPGLAPISGPTNRSIQQSVSGIKPLNQPSGPLDVVGQVGRFVTNVWNGLRSLL